MHKIAYPIIKNAAEGRLHKALPLTADEKKRGVAYLEAIGRTVNGIAPWLELSESKITSEYERKLQAEYRVLTRKAMANAADPDSDDYCVWNKSNTNLMADQPVVDAAFYASAILKAPHQLWDLQDEKTKKNIIKAFDKTLLMRANRSNWLMFTAIIETCRYKLTGIGDAMRIDLSLALHYDWYKGDGMYGDGELFVMNYYNSYVIQPMLEEVTRNAQDIIVEGKFREQAVNAISRYSEILEHMIAPDGSFPFLGRSITYRMGAFHALAHAALVGLLPKELPANQVRCALTRVIDKTMSAPSLFDENGFLTKGLYGKQESLADEYVNCGSLYLTTFIFLPLGLAPSHQLWSGEDVKITWEKAWNGEKLEKDVALEARPKKKKIFGSLFGKN